MGEIKSTVMPLFSTTMQGSSCSSARLTVWAAVVLALVGLIGASTGHALGPNAMRPGFNANTLPGNDDGSTGLVPIGFTVNFFGTNYSGLYVNNNGNLTFDAALSEFTPFDLTSPNRVIIAPFFADVDTRVGNVVTFGTGTVAILPLASIGLASAVLTKTSPC